MRVALWYAKSCPNTTVVDNTRSRCGLGEFPAPTDFMSAHAAGQTSSLEGASSFDPALIIPQEFSHPSQPLSPKGGFMRFAARCFVFGLLISMCFAGVASAQYMRLISDNPADPTKMRPTGTTILTITLDTNHDKNGTLQTCNSHTAATCGAPATSQ